MLRKAIDCAKLPPPLRRAASPSYASARPHRRSPTGTLRWGHRLRASGLEPPAPAPTPPTPQTQSYDGLMAHGRKMARTIEPALATEWTVTPTDIHLQACVTTFASMTARRPTPTRLIANIENVQAASNRWRKAIGGIEEVVKVDEHTVLFEPLAPEPLAALHPHAARPEHDQPEGHRRRHLGARRPSAPDRTCFNQSETVSGSTYDLRLFRRLLTLRKSVGP